jgi:signal transduction histidine kinase
VERFDGELELVSEENQGSAFTVRLPLFEGED